MELEIGDVEKSYCKNDGLTKKDVMSLRDWAKGQAHLPKMTEMQTIHFLHSNGFDVEATKVCIKKFYTSKTRSPEFFANRNPHNIDLDVVTYFELPPTPDGHRVIYGTLVDPNPTRYTFADQIKLFDMTSMLMLNKNGTSPGQHVIHDMNGLTFGHLTRINIFQLRKFFYYLQEAMPVRLKGLHFINTGTLVDKVLSLIKPFMKKELVDILYAHPQIETIYQHIPKTSLPSDCGGFAPSIAELHCVSKEELLKHADFFIAEERQMADESKRQGSSEGGGMLFGIKSWLVK